MSYSDGVRNVVRAIGHGCVWICEETLEEMFKDIKYESDLPDLLDND